MPKIIFILFCSFLYFTALTQVAPISTDRPGRTISASTVLNKWLQTEMGFQREVTRFQPILKDVYTQHPSLLIKYGIGNLVEIRLVSEIVTLTEENVNGKDIYKGINNVQLGGKFNFLKETGIIPKTSFIAHYRFNRLNTLFKDTIDGANFRLAMLNNVSDNFSIGYNVGLELNRFGSLPIYIYTFSPQYKFLENWIAFVEVFSYARKKSPMSYSVDGGISYLINDNFKIDATFGLKLKEKYPNKFFGVGGSFRFDTSKKN